MGDRPQRAGAGLPKRRRSLVFLAAALSWLTAAVLPAGAAEPDGSLATAPRFSTLGGGEVALTQYRGRPLLLNLWATWCPPCVAELPSLQALRNGRGLAGDAAGGRLEVVALNVGQSINQVETFLATLPRPLDLPVVLDRHRRALDHWNVRMLPTTLVFDADGRLRATFVGERDWAAPAAAGEIAAALSSRGHAHRP